MLIWGGNILVWLWFVSFLAFPLWSLYQNPCLLKPLGTCAKALTRRLLKHMNYLGNKTYLGDSSIFQESETFTIFFLCLLGKCLSLLRLNFCLPHLLRTSLGRVSSFPAQAHMSSLTEFACFLSQHSLIPLGCALMTTEMFFWVTLIPRY